MYFRLSYLLFFLLMTISLAAQRANETPVATPSSISIKVTVVDSVNSQSVEFASVRLFNAQANQLVQGGLTDKNGSIELKEIKRGSYYLLLSFTGYNTKRIVIGEKSFRKGNLNLGKIKLGNANVMLGEVTVTGKLPELVIKEDTMEYNAAAFKTPEGAVVEDLLKRLPGIQVDADGKITTASGKQISKIRVNGKEFFGNDPKMATKNLTADVIDKVQVIDKKSDLAILTGVDDDDPETIINLTVKKGMMKGWMGNLTGGAGQIIDNKNNEDPRYTAGSMLNRFTDSDQYSIVANSNNINERASTDRGNNVRTGRGNGGGVSGSSNGITSSSTIGFNMAKDVNSKLKVGGNVSYNYGDNYTNSNSFRKNIFTDSVSYRRSSSESRNYSHNLSAAAKVEYQMDSLTTFILTPTFAYNSSLSHNSSYQKTMAGDIDSTAVNESNSNNTLNSNGTSLGMQLDFSRKLSAKGRRISFSGSFNIDDSKGNGTNNSSNTFFLTPSKNSVYDQRSNNTANRNTYNLRMTYVEPLAKNYFLDFMYNVQFNNTTNEKETYDYDTTTETYSDLDAKYSRSSSVQTVSQSIRAYLKAVFPKYTYNIGITVAPNYSKNKGYIKDWYGDGRDSVYNDPAARRTLNYAPQLEFTYRIDNSKLMRKYLRMRYNGRTAQPSVSQLDPSQDATNPLSIRSGNSDLLPSFNHNLSLEYNSNNRTSQQSFGSSLTATLIQNSIVNYTTYESGTGVQYTKPVNENGTWNAQADVMFASPLDEKMHFNLNAQADAGYSNQVGFTLVQKQSQRNIAHTTSLSPSLALSYKNDWFYNQFRGKYNYSASTYSMQGISAQRSANYNVMYNAQVTFPASLSLSSDIAYTATRGLSTGYNQEQVIWNAQLSKSFLTNNAALVRLQLNDILRQKLNISRSVTTTSITDTQYTALTSYYMLSFTYRFNNMGGKHGKRPRSMDGNVDGFDSPNPGRHNHSGGGFGNGGGFGRDR
jgi:hypothetical protein